MTTRLAFTLFLVAAPAFAQLELPHPSPHAKVGLTVGLTDIAVEYSSPAVKGRKIWGGLLKYDELWRAGANQATKITFSKDVTVADKAVPAGAYALFIIPSAKGPWTVILNKNVNQGGTRDYKQDLDLLRFTAKPSVNMMREHLTYLFNNITDESASIDLEWERVRLAIPVKAKTAEQTAASIKQMTETSWEPYTGAARFLLEQKKDYDGALKLVDQSLALREMWLNVWTKAQLLAAKGDYKDAYPLAEKAKALGDAKPDSFFYSDDVKKALSDWKGK